MTSNEQCSKPLLLDDWGLYYPLYESIIQERGILTNRGDIMIINRIDDIGIRGDINIPLGMKFPGNSWNKIPAEPLFGAPLDATPLVAYLVCIFPIEEPGTRPGKHTKSY